jgi:hypothetical protein
MIGHDELAAIARVGVAPDEARFVDPLARDASALASRSLPGRPVVLLGSIATGKYVDVLDRVFGARLLFPSEFVGRGDMSRGGCCCARRAPARSSPTGRSPARRDAARGPPRLERVL